MFLCLKVFTKSLKGNKLNNKGLTLIELMAVITIIGILAAIAVLSVTGIIEKSKEDVCGVNALRVERMYEMHLTLNSIEHSDVVFTQHLLEYGEGICPEDGVFSYVDGEVQCSVHSNDDEEIEDEEEGGSGGVPFL